MERKLSPPTIASMGRWWPCSAVMQSPASFTHLDDDHGAIVVGLDAADELGKRGVRGIDDVVRALLVISADGLGEALEAELLARVIPAFHDAVGIEDQYISGLK